MSVDTSRKAVERLTRLLTEQPFDATAAEYAEVAATLRALLAERDAARDSYDGWMARVLAAKAERDAAYQRGWEAGREAAAEACNARGWDTAKHRASFTEEIKRDEADECARAIRALMPPEAAP